MLEWETFVDISDCFASYCPGNAHNRVRSSTQKMELSPMSVLHESLHQQIFLHCWLLCVLYAGGQKTPHLEHLLLEQPGYVIILVSLSRDHNVLWADDEKCLLLHHAF